MGFQPLIGAFLLFFVIYGFVVPFFATKLENDGWSEIISMGFFTACFALYCFLIRSTVAPLFANPGFWRGVKCWAVAFPIVFLWAALVDAFMVSVMGFSPQEQAAVLVLKSSLQNPSLFAFTAIFVVAIVPVIEELLFRGLMQNWLRQVMGAKGAIVLTSFIFALFHVSDAQGWTNLTIVSSLFVMSLFLGTLLEVTKSLRAPIGLHMTYNLMSVVFIIVKEAS